MIEAEAECVSAALREAQAQGVAHRLSAQAAAPQAWILLNLNVGRSAADVLHGAQQRCRLPLAFAGGARRPAPAARRAGERREGAGLHVWLV